MKYFNVKNLLKAIFHAPRRRINFEISDVEQKKLEFILKYEVDSIIRDKVKAILLLHQGSSLQDISKFLFLDIQDAQNCVKMYQNEGCKGILKSKYNELPKDIDISKLYSGYSLDWAEAKAAEIIWPEIKEFSNYLNSVYNLCFKLQTILDKKSLRKEISDPIRGQMMILMRITDFLRCMTFLTRNGYPEQAGTLAASIFELSHTAISFSYHSEGATKWLESDSIRDEVPEILSIPIGKGYVKNYKQLVDENYRRMGEPKNAEAEYKVYKQLCWMKHSAPKMQDIVVKKDMFEFRSGPYTDERSINHAWFSMFHVGKLTVLLIQSFLKITEKLYIFSEELQAISLVMDDLNKKAMNRFGTHGPF